ncbi:MAG: ketoacyl-ACP synthase III [Deltaproteobacteria bacterium]|nr:ketoacyl-ACP synthase III [Deltaproteobacteria bacterium]MBI4794272.1 ketoacyl-ACP synthase III [Deltaproteobacteria bacterium]
MAAKNINILGTGAYVPERVLTNEDLEKIVDTSSTWIMERTGIRERRIAAPDEDIVTMGVAAARLALAAAGLEARQLSYIILATNSPNYLYPAAAIRVQDALGLNGVIGAFDLQAGCCGFNYALYVAERLVAQEGKYALVIGSDANSRFTDWTNRSTCILFGDGAGAVVVGPAQKGRIVTSFIASSLNMNLHCETEFNQEVSPFLPPQTHTERHFLTMDGPEVFKFAVGAVKESIRRIMETTQLNREDLDFLILHQANWRILDAGARFAKVPMEKVFVNVDRYGNTSAASVPIALHEAVQEGKIKEGDKVLLVSFGAGATWGAALIEWGK